MFENQTIEDDIKEKYNNALAALELTGKDPIAGRLDDIIAAYDGDKQSEADKTRFYHGLEHVSDLLMQAAPNVGGLSKENQQEALAVLAIINHDVIYAHVDRAIEKDAQGGIAGVLADYVEQRDGQIFLKPLEQRTENYEAALTLFDLPQQQRDGEKPLNPNAGQNELLSALLLADDLAVAGVPLKDRLVVIADIAATVPFGKEDHLQQIHTTLVELNNKLPEGERLPEEELGKAGKFMVDIANADVKSFTKDDFADTFKDSQNLMLESIVGKNNKDPDIAQNFLDGAVPTSGFMGFLSGQFDNAPKLIYHGAEIAGVGEYSSNLDLSQMNAQATETIKAIKLAVDSQIAATHLLVELNEGNPQTNLKEAMKTIAIPPISEDAKELNAVGVKALSGIEDKPSPFPQTDLAVSLLKEGGAELINEVNNAAKEKKSVKEVLEKHNIHTERYELKEVVQDIQADNRAIGEKSKGVGTQQQQRETG